MLKYVYLKGTGAEDAEEELINDINWFNTDIIKEYLDSLDDEAFEKARQKLKESY